MITQGRLAATDPLVTKTMFDRTAAAIRGRNETNGRTARTRATVGMTGIQIKTGISETVFPAGRFVWKMRTGHALAMRTGHALAMRTGHALAKISLSHRHVLALPHRSAAAHIAIAQETAVTARGKMRKSSIRRGCQSLMRPATIE
jgi:hypothetical protein